MSPSFMHALQLQEGGISNGILLVLDWARIIGKLLDIISLYGKEIRNIVKRLCVGVRHLGSPRLKDPGNDVVHYIPTILFECYDN